MSVHMPADMARIPAWQVRNRLGDTLVGAAAWCVPWAIEVDAELRCWLNLDAPAHDDPSGTVAMLVERTGDTQWRCTVPRDRRWTPSRRLVTSGLVPVTELVIE